MFFNGVSAGAVPSLWEMRQQLTAEQDETQLARETWGEESEWPENEPS
jgi:hypothetical protein